MKDTEMRSSFLQLSFFLFALTFVVGCGDGFGDKIVVDGTEIFFDGENVTKAEAEKLGQALKAQEFTDGTEKSVQFQKQDDKLILKIVLQPEYIKSGELDRELKLMGLQFSAIFDGQNFECHACDETLVTKRQVTSLHGKRIQYGKGELYYNGLSDEQLAGIKSVLEELGFLEFEGSLFFGKSKGGYEFRMVCSEEFQQDDELKRESKIWQSMFSKTLDDAEVIVMLCDEYFEPTYTRKWETTTAIEDK